MIKTRYKDFILIKGVTDFWKVYVGCLCLAIGIENLAKAVAFCDSLKDM